MPEQLALEDGMSGSGEPQVKRWWVYILRCEDRSLYTGITTDPQRRLAQHNAGRGAKYTRSRHPVTLVYQEEARDKSEALRRERAIKALSHRSKEELANKGRGETGTKDTASKAYW